MHYLHRAYSYDKNQLEENKVFFPLHRELKALERWRLSTPVPSRASVARRESEQRLGGRGN